MNTTKEQLLPAISVLCCQLLSLKHNYMIHLLLAMNKHTLLN